MSAAPDPQAQAARVAALKTNDPTNPAHRLAQDLQSGRFASMEQRDDLLDLLSPKSDASALSELRAKIDAVRVATKACAPSDLHQGRLDAYAVCLGAIDTIRSQPAPSDFGAALNLMRAGAKVQRPAWSAEEWISLDKQGALINEDGTPTRFADNAPLLATDWRVVP